MWSYFWTLGLRSLKRTPGMTILMVVTVGLGIGTSMTTFAVFRAASGDPIPGKSSELYVPQLDAWGPSGTDTDGEPPNTLTYIDAMALIESHAAPRLSVHYPVSFSVIPDDPSRTSFRVNGHAAYTDLFPMVEAPFAFGGPWSADDDSRGSPLIVLSAELNDKLFGGANSIGREVNLDDEHFRVIGVLAPWNPQPLFYDVRNTGGFADPDAFFVPFRWAVDHEINTSGNDNCDVDAEPGYQGWLHSSCIWVAALVELPTTADVQKFTQFLDGYHREQQASGRFDWAPNNRLRNVRQWLDYMQVVPDESRVSMLIAFGFLVVCLCNVVGLMLARFMRRAPEIGVRRALGATRWRILQQFTVEAGVLGLAGGLLGLLFTVLGLSSVHLIFEQHIADLATLDPTLVVLTLLLAVLATIAAGLFPTFRASQVRPAWQLKIN